MNQQTDILLKRIDSKLTALLSKKQETWVPVSWISELTGWDHHRMARARKDGLIEFRKKGKGYEYKIESVPEAFINKKAV